MSIAVKRHRSERIELRATALADRTEFVLDADAWEAWEALNRRPARDLPSFREFMQRPSPFIDE